MFVFYNHHWPLNRSNRASPPGSFAMLCLSKIKTFESRQPDNPLSATLPHLQISPPQLLPLSFPFPSSPARVVFSLSPASLRHKEASRIEDLQHDSKTLSPVAAIHRELESRPNTTTPLCPEIHANEAGALYYEQPEVCCSSNRQVNAFQAILSNMKQYAKYKLCQVPKVRVLFISGPKPSASFFYLQSKKKTHTKTERSTATFPA